MAFDHYKLADIVAPGPILAKKGILIVGSGTCDVNFYQPLDFSSGVTSPAVRPDAGDQATLTGTVQGAIVPIAVHTLVRVDAGTTVHKLA